MRGILALALPACVLLAATPGCRDGCRASGGPLRQLGDTESAATGETLFTLTGGALVRPIDIPLWLELDETDDDGKCPLHTEHVFFELPGGSVYIGQYNSWCGGPSQCRILDPSTRKLSKPPGGCISPSGVHMYIEALGDSWLAVHSDAEGVGWIDYMTYSPIQGPTTHLHIETAHDGQVEARVTPSGLELTSNFDLIDPLQGLVVAGEDPVEHHFTWTKSTGLVRRQPTSP